MAVTRYKKNVTGQPLKSVRFTASADNDVLLAAGNYIVVAAYFHGAHLTALNLDSGADITAYPFTTAANAVCATSDGTAGDVTILFSELPTAGLDTFSI